ncbi:MAG: hypothetical protein ACE5IR_08340 [bacterium]
MENIPHIIKKFYSEKRWPELFWLFKKLWDRDGWRYLKRNKNAVARIKQEFTRLTGKPAYAADSNARNWDEKVAKHAAACGAAALIDDMRAAMEHKPQSLIYFLYSKHGACRWEMLFLRKLEEQLKAEKKKIDSELAELAKLLDFRMPEVEAEWIMQARAERRKLLRYLDKFDMPEERRADIKERIRRIEHNLKKGGFQL